MMFFENSYRIINKYNQKAKIAKQYGSHKAITTTKLAEVLGITKGAVSQVTRKLLEKNLITKVASKEKVNEVFISLTDKGKVVYAYHRNIHEKMLCKIDLILSNLPEESKNAMNKILQAIEDSLDEL